MMLAMQLMPPPQVWPMRIRAALQLPLPGWAAQSRMLPIPRGARQSTAPPRPGAVLLALVAGPAGPSILLTLRASSTRQHAGQIALPGGALDRGDASLWATALREAHEEIGLAAEAVELLGALTPLYVPTSNYCVHPFVGWVALRPAAWRLSPAEVAAMLELPLASLLRREARGEETWRVGARDVRVPFYRAGVHAVWGATAMILSELEVALCAQPREVSQHDHR
jgi:8-oxo-dGTP pyrophosphatase MutT (NUDIX family)